MSSITMRVLSALERGPNTVAALAKQVHASEGVVRRQLDALQIQKLVHFAAYIRSTRGPFCKQYALGRGSGVAPEKPELMPPAEKNARWRQNGGDSHRSRRLAVNAKKIGKSMSMAGLLGVE